MESRSPSLRADHCVVCWSDNILQLCFPTTGTLTWFCNNCNWQVTPPPWSASIGSPAFCPSLSTSSITTSEAEEVTPLHQHVSPALEPMLSGELREAPVLAASDPAVQAHGITHGSEVQQRSQQESQRQIATPALLSTATTDSVEGHTLIANPNHVHKQSRAPQRRSGATWTQQDQVASTAEDLIASQFQPPENMPRSTAAHQVAVDDDPDTRFLPGHSPATSSWSESFKGPRTRFLNQEQRWKFNFHRHYGVCGPCRSRRVACSPLHLNRKALLAVPSHVWETCPRPDWIPDFELQKSVYGDRQRVRL